MARLVARVLSEESAAGRLQVQGVTLSDRMCPTDIPLHIRPSRGSRLAFVWQCARGAFGSTHHVYDSANISQAHPRIPGLRRPFLTFLCGVEAWENAKPRWLRAARRADVLLAITRYTLERAERVHGSFPRAAVCWLGTESDSLPVVSPSSQPAHPTVLILGRLHPASDKGHAALVASWARVRSAVPDAELIIAGEGPLLASVRSLARTSPAGESIRVLGHVDEAELGRLFRTASVFAMPSRAEGFGLVYVEAMRYGLPVIASVHDAGREINIDGVTGYNVSLERSQDLGDCMVHLLRDRDAAVRMGEAGRQRWADLFRYSAFRARFLEHLRALLGLP